jgi:hypothetical protein
MKRSKGGEKSTETLPSPRQPGRQRRCQESASRALPDGENTPPGERGACAKTSRSQGSE